MKLIKKEITKKEYDNYSKTRGYEKAESKNGKFKNFCVNNKTKLIIVGTMTPPKGYGFYYTTNSKMYKYIDAATKTTDLRCKMYRLRECSKNGGTKNECSRIIKTMIDELNESHICFLDVAKFVIRKKGRSEDKMIKYIVFDYKAFKNLKSVNIICNSLDAEECLYKIMCKNGAINSKIKYLSLWRDDEKEWVKTIRGMLK